MVGLRRADNWCVTCRIDWRANRERGRDRTLWKYTASELCGDLVEEGVICRSI